MIPPLLIEHRDNGDDVMKLTMSFYTMEINKMGSVSWPPNRIYSNDDDYELIEKEAWDLVIGMWTHPCIHMVPRWATTMRAMQEIMDGDSETLSETSEADDMETEINVSGSSGEPRASTVTGESEASESDEPIDPNTYSGDETEEEHAGA